MTNTKIKSPSAYEKQRLEDSHKRIVNKVICKLEKKTKTVSKVTEKIYQISHRKTTEFIKKDLKLNIL